MGRVKKATAATGNITQEEVASEKAKADRRK